MKLLTDMIVHSVYMKQVHRVFYSNIVEASIERSEESKEPYLR